MSYDVWCEVNTGSGNKLRSEWLNYTSNCVCMWDDAMMMRHLRDMDGMKCGSCAIYLQQGSEKMMLNKEKYEKMNPDNGWGCYDGALQFIVDIYKLCKEHPGATLRVSY